MKYSEFIKHLIAGKYAPVYFFYGEETYFSEEAIQKITAKFVTAGSVEFNRDLFFGEEANGAQIVNAAMAIPMMAKNRVVIVKNFQKLSQSDKELIVKYMRKPAPHTILILVAEAVDFRKKVYAELKKNAFSVDCSPLYENQIPAYVQEFVRDRGKRISMEAIRLLQSRSGNSLRELMNEIEKLIGYVEKRPEITVEDVEKLVGLSRSFNVFELWDAIGERDLSRSLKILRQMLETGERPVFLVTSLTTYFTRLWKIRLLRRKGLNASQIAKELHIHPFFMNRTMSQAARFTEGELKEIMAKLLQTDIHLKTGYLKPELLMELFLVDVLRNKRAA